MSQWVLAGSVDELKAEKAKVIKGGVAVFFHEDMVYAVDNRCPHMGFPLHMGSLCDGILTCHWHHARFDVCSGGTLDPWADDVPVYETKEDNGEVWVNTALTQSLNADVYKERLLKGLEQNLGLVIAKSVVGLVKSGVSDKEIMETAVQFGVSHRSSGWGPGLTILSAMANVLPKLDEEGRIQALFQGMTHVARNCAGQPPHHLTGPLTGFSDDTDKLKKWYRNCVEVRDTKGAERIILTAAEYGMSTEELSAMMMSAATDHMFMDAGHTLDFHNKAFELLPLTDTETQKSILASLTPLFANAVRSEELHSWQAPVDLVRPLHKAFSQLNEGLPEDGPASFEREKLLEQLLSDEPVKTIDHLTGLLKKGVPPVKIAQIVSLAAASRAVHFHTQNDFADWITVLHTFTHAHAVHESLRRSGGNPDTIRAVYHAAMTVYLDRFLNVPSSKRPRPSEAIGEMKPKEFLALLDKQQQVNEAGQWAVDYLHRGGDRDILFQTFGHALLREDADFHTYQMYEAVTVEFERWDEEKTRFAEQAKETVIIAAARYLAAHAPTAREMPRVGKIAWRLHQGEKLFEDQRD